MLASIEIKNIPNKKVLPWLSTMEDISKRNSGCLGLSNREKQEVIPVTVKEIRKYSGLLEVFMKEKDFSRMMRYCIMLSGKLPKARIYFSVKGADDSYSYEYLLLNKRVIPLLYEDQKES